MPILIGIDPGRTAGWVCLEVEEPIAVLAATPDFNPSSKNVLRYVDRGTISVRTLKALDTPDKQDADYAKRWGDLFDSQLRYASEHSRPCPVVVCEQPRDAKEVWAGKRGGRHSKTETFFRAGVYYGIIRTVVEAISTYGDQYFDLDFQSYTVKEWMQGRPRKTTDLLIRNAAKNIQGLERQTVDDWAAWSEHETMALGVLLWHLGRLIPTEAR